MDNISETEPNEEVVIEVIEERSGFRTVTFICSVIMIWCCAWGIFGNIMSLIIFTRPSMRRLSVNVLLTGLSIVDLMLVALAVPTFAVPGLNDYLLDLKLYESYDSVVLFLYPAILTLQTCSIYTFVLITIERYYAVCRPLIVKRLLTVRRARVAQFFIFLLAIAYNCIRFFEYSRSSPGPETEDFGRNLRKDKLYFTVYYTSLYLVTHFLIPFIVITSLNTQILRRLHRARRERERLSNAQQEQGRTTRMIIVVTLLFGLCNTLPFVINLWEVFDFNLFDEPPSVEYDVEQSDLQEISSLEHSYTRRDTSPLKTSIAYLLLDLSNTLVVANAASPFIVCLIYCKRYRKLFCYCFTWICRLFQPPDSNLALGSSSYSSYGVSRPPCSTSMEFTDMRSRSNTNRTMRSCRSDANWELKPLYREDRRISFGNELLVPTTIDRSLHVRRRSADSLQRYRNVDNQS